MKKIIAFVFLIITGIFLVTSCSYDKEELLYPATACDTIHVTYLGTIAPLVQSHCRVCHSTVNPSGGVIAVTWEGLNTVAIDGRLWGALNHEAGYIPMPKDQGKLSDCDLAKFNIWILAGAPNN